MYRFLNNGQTLTYINFIRALLYGEFLLEKGFNYWEKLAKEYFIISMVERLEPVVVERGEGALLYDVEGKEYIDLFAGISVVNSGHARKEIVEAAFEQAKKLIHAGTYVYYVPTTIKLAQKLAEIIPGKLKKTFFGNSGAEANECALKLARKYTKKHEFIALMCSFHGRTLGTLSITGQWARRRYDMGPYLSGASFTPAPYCYRCPFNHKYPECDIACAHFVEHVIRYSTSNNVAAFIVEPVLGEGGIIPLPNDYLKIVKEILDRYNILLIVDEVQTGFARTGKIFAIEHYGIEPDIMTMAKGIANGFPISACTVRPEIGDAFEPGDHLSTFGGNPVSAAAALANIEIMLKENLPQKVNEKGKYVMKRLEEMKEKHKIIGDVRGKGLMIGVEIVEDQETKKPSVEKAKKIRELARKKGILIGKGGVVGSVIRIQPPLVISKEQLDKALNILEETIASVEKE